MTIILQIFLCALVLRFGVIVGDIQFIPLEDGICSQRKRWRGGEGECRLTNASNKPEVSDNGKNAEAKQNTTLVVLAWMRR